VLDGLAQRAYYVHAGAEGYLPGKANRGEPVVVGWETVEHVDVELAAGGALLTGTVLDATGGPIAGAHVRAVRALPPILAIDTTADGDGRFRFPLHAGFIEIVATAEGYARGSVEATAPGEVELRLVPGSSVEGTVVSAESGEPVGGVEVKAISRRNPQRALAEGGISEANGRFRITGLEPGSYALSAVGDGLYGADDRPLQLGLADHRDGVVIEVRRAAQLAGRVVIDTDRQPCRQGTVAIGQPSPDQPMPSPEEIAAVTGGLQIERATAPGHTANIEADGTVRFPAVPDGYYFVQVSCRSHRLRAGPRLLRVGDEDLQDLAWTVSPAASVLVRVVDERGTPIERADFYVELPSRGPRIIEAYQTDGAGLATVEGLLPGAYKVHAPHGYAEVPPVAFEIDDDAAEVKLTLTLPGSGFVLATFATETGEPLDGLQVMAREAVADGAQPKQVSALPMGTGRYRMGPLKRGTYEVIAADGVHASATGDAPAGAEVQVGAGRVTETRITLRRGGAIEGQVVDETGAPVPDVWVSVASDRLALAAGQTKRVLSDSEGRFLIGGLSPDAVFRVVASEPQGRGVIQRGVRAGDRLVIALTAAAERSDFGLK
jgi:protocatechuate 3,4-dioxygenase beta subunit